MPAGFKYIDTELPLVPEVPLLVLPSHTRAVSLFRPSYLLFSGILLCPAVKTLLPFQKQSGCALLGIQAAARVWRTALNSSNPDEELFHYYECCKRPQGKTRSSCLP